MHFSLSFSSFTTDGLGDPVPDTIHLLLASKSNHNPVRTAMRECKCQSVSDRQAGYLLDSTVV